MINTAKIQHSDFTATDPVEINISAGENEQIIQALLQENNDYERHYTFKPVIEFLNFLKFTASMFVAFPVGIYMRSRIRKNKRLNHIMQFNELLQVRNNIEKGSFAYDTILFKQSPLQLLKNKSHLANLVCLAILFGDEFIDGVATEHGRENIQRILNNRQFSYYLQYQKSGGGYELYYEFDICDVLPTDVQESINKKYGITYKAFYNHLQFLLWEMNLYLNKAGDEKTLEAAQLICRVCNRCFDTYKADINEFDESHSLAQLLQYQKNKDEDIIQILLTLRAVLLDKKQLQYQKLFGSWSSMVRSMQLYDDMQDVAVDCGFQMNTTIFFAKNYFTNEWQWLQQNRKAVTELSGLQLHTAICYHMPGSCILTLQYACNISHTRLCWVQQKIQNYLWRKNWLGFNNQLLSAFPGDIADLLQKKDKSILLKLHYIKSQVMHIESSLISEEMKWAFIADIALLDPELKHYLLKKITRKERYHLLSCYLEFPIVQKAALVKRILNHS